MADKKISALTAATTPLAGTEVLPIVQSSSTVKVTVADLTAGRAVSATQLTLTTGNLIVASGQGVDFSATSGTGTSELLNDYEEGTWTPNQGGGLTVIGAFTSSGTYTKIGRQVTVSGRINAATSVAVSANGVISTNLPFSSAVIFTGAIMNDAATSSGGIYVNGAIVVATTTFAATPALYFSATFSV
tara:strand:+ start:449 stop:1012 length:564 start_codon:yes stop_codon:yes gene_type:complete